MMEEISCINFILFFLGGVQTKDQICLEHDIQEQLHFDNNAEREMTLLNCISSPQIFQSKNHNYIRTLQKLGDFPGFFFSHVQLLNACPMIMTLNDILQSLGFRYGRKIIYLGKKVNVKNYLQTSHKKIPTHVSLGFISGP